MSLKSVNLNYLYYLSYYPLLTKSATAGILGGLNEVIASVIAKDYRESTIKGARFKHILSPKIFTMMIYGSCIMTPISHHLYGLLNRAFAGRKMTLKMKIAQVLSSLMFISPLLSGIFTSWLALTNNYRVSTTNLNFAEEFKRIVNIIASGLKNSYLPILKTSVFTSLWSFVTAQTFLDPEIWVVFFTFVYFVLGTVQNTRVKLLQRQKSKKD